MLNKVMLIGNLGSDPELRYTSNQTAVANLRVATSEKYKDKDGNQQDKTEWHSVSCFGKLAEIMGKYLHKGSKVYLEGKLRTRKWTGQDGIERYKTEVLIDFEGKMRMLDGKGQQNHQDHSNQPSQQQAPAGPRQDFDDEIPF